jgi:putative RNA 2'-phosphotransferase
LELDQSGWADVQELIQKADRFTMEELEYIVANNNKKRFAFNSDKTKIRASQGHSIDIDLNYKESRPPAALYHGTATRFVDKIMKDGLKKMNRHHVHLSDDCKTAVEVGRRHGKAVVFKIWTSQMYEDGFKFYISDNGVWLTEHVPEKYFMDVLYFD